MSAIATLADARSRAARIRIGISSYLSTLSDVAAAYAQRDWEALGYSTWQQYVDGEYSEQRLKLSPEHRQKAVAELRLAGLSQTAIATAVGVSQGTVRNDLVQVSKTTNLPERIQGADGKQYTSSQPAKPKVEPEPVPDEPAPVDLPKHQEHADASLSLVDEAEEARATVAEVMDRVLPPDTEGPKIRWRINFLGAIQPCRRLLAQFRPEQVVDSADEECLDELARLADDITSYVGRVRAARSIPDNVRHLRAVS